MGNSIKENLNGTEQRCISLCYKFDCPYHVQDEDVHKEEDLSFAFMRECDECSILVESELSYYDEIIYERYNDIISLTRDNENADEIADALNGILDVYFFERWCPCDNVEPMDAGTYEVTIEDENGERSVTFATFSLLCDECGHGEWDRPDVVAWREKANPYMEKR